MKSNLRILLILASILCLFTNVFSQSEIGNNDFRISDMGQDGSSSYKGVLSSIAYNSINNEYLVVWEGTDAFTNVQEIYGQRLNAQGVEIGDNDFQISQLKTNGDSQYGSFAPAVTYNVTENEYLVVWHGDKEDAPFAEGEREIFGQRLSNTGMEIGDDDFRISSVGPDGNTSWGAFKPSVAYNSTNNQYLVVWYGSHDIPPLSFLEYEIYGQRLSATGVEIGADDFRISDMSVDGENSGIFNWYDARIPDVAYNSINNEYLVVWYGDDVTPVEYEIYGQRLSNIGVEIGTNDFRISEIGPDGNAEFDALEPKIAYNSTNNEYLVTWYGKESAAFGFAIYAQRISNTGAQIGVSDLRISDLGTQGMIPGSALNVDLCYNPSLNNYLVVWQGEESIAPLVNNEKEIFGQILSNTGLEIGTNDIRLSDMGGLGNTSYRGSSPAPIFNTSSQEYLVVWHGTDNIAPLVFGENEIFGQRINASLVIQPEIQFNSNKAYFNEGTDCDNQVVTINLTAKPAPTAPVIVTLTTTLVTAEPEDFNLTSNHVTFLPGQSYASTTVEITNDILIEAVERFDLEITNVGGGNAIKSPDLQIQQVSIFDDDISANANGWFQDFNIGTGQLSSAQGCPIECTYNQKAVEIIYTAAELQAAGMVAGVIWEFEFQMDKKHSQFGLRDVSLKIGHTALNAFPGNATFGNNFSSGNFPASINQPQLTEGSLSIVLNNGFIWDGVSNILIQLQHTAPALIFEDKALGHNPGFTAMIYERWNDDGSGHIAGSAGNAGIGLNFRPNTKFYQDIPQNSTIQTAVNSANGFAEIDLSPMTTVEFFDSQSGRIMAKIENTSNHNFGCTKVEIDHAGTGANEAWHNGYSLTEKTFLVTPEFNNPNANYTIHLYYKEPEIAGWENANPTGQSRSDLKMVKTMGTVSSGNSNNIEIIAPMTTTFGNDLIYTANFNTGFSGFALGNLSENPHDICSDALPITVNLDESCTLLNSSFTKATNSNGNDCNNNPVKDVWYTFQPTLNNYEFELSNFDNNVEMGLEIFENDCANLQSVQCIEQTTMTAVGLLRGSTYQLRVWTTDASSAAGSDFDLCVKNQPAPDNDLQINAININTSLSIDCNTQFSGSTQNATAVETACGGGAVADVWYQFTAQFNAANFTLNNTSGIVGMELLIQNGGNLNSIICQEVTSFSYDNFDKGSVYFLRIYSPEISSGTNFDLCITAHAPTNNNVCNQSTPLPVNPDNICIQTVFTNFDNTTSSGTTCNNIGADLWYSFTATQAKHTISLLNNNQNLDIAVFTGTCNNLTQIVCDDIFNDLIINNLIANQIYFIALIIDAQLTNHDFNICVRTPPIIINDECAAAINIPVNPNENCNQTTAGTTIGASHSELDCFGGNTRDVWYQFVALNTTQVIELLNTNSINAGIEIYESNCGALQSLGCNNSDNKITIQNLTTNSTYLVRVFTGEFSSTINFDLCIREQTPPPPNDFCNTSENLIPASNATPRAGTTLAATMSSTDCLGSNSFDVWYHFVASENSHTVQLSNIETNDPIGFTDLGIEVYSGGCAGLNSIVCHDFSFDIQPTNGLTIGQTYWVRVFQSEFNASATFEIAISATTALPVELINFSARLAEDFVELNWQTVFEKNNLGFEIQRSMDGHSFNKIGWQNGQTNSNNLIHYFYKDNQIEKGQIYYYRLKQMDENSTFSYTHIESIHIPNENTISIFPNPFQETIFIKNSQNSSPIEIQIFNTVGQLMHSEFLEDSSKILSLNNLPKGVYQIVFRENGKLIFAQKLFKS